MKVPLYINAGLALALACAPHFAAAEIFALAHDEAANATVIRNTGTAVDSTARVAACCEIANGSPTFDVLGNRAFFIAQATTGAELVSFNYGTGASSRLPLGAPYRVTHMEYDAGSGQLLALARDVVSDALVMAAINPLTAQLTVRALMVVPCCTLKIGISVMSGSGNAQMLVIGRAAGSEDALLIFNFNTNTGPTEVALPANLRITDLERHPLNANVYGFAHAVDTGLGRAFLLGPAPTFTPALLGAGHAGCCFVQAGASAIDRVNNELVLIGRESAGSPPSLQRFNLNSGARSSGIALTAHALFEDFGLQFDRLFSDGFEGP